METKKYLFFEKEVYLKEELMKMSIGEYTWKGNYKLKRFDYGYNQDVIYTDVCMGENYILLNPIKMTDIDVLFHEKDDMILYFRLPCSFFNVFALKDCMIDPGAINLFDSREYSPNYKGMIYGRVYVCIESIEGYKKNTLYFPNSFIENHPKEFISGTNGLKYYFNQVDNKELYEDLKPSVKKYIIDNGLTFKNLFIDVLPILSSKYRPKREINKLYSELIVKSTEFGHWLEFVKTPPYYDFSQDLTYRYYMNIQVNICWLSMHIANYEGKTSYQSYRKRYYLFSKKIYSSRELLEMTNGLVSMESDLTDSNIFECCERFSCQCGKLTSLTASQKVCDNCDSMLLKRIEEGDKFGHIQMNYPIYNIFAFCNCDSRELNRKINHTVSMISLFPNENPDILDVICFNAFLLVDNLAFNDTPKIKDVAYMREYLNNKRYSILMGTNAINFLFDYFPEIPMSFLKIHSSKVFYQLDNNIIKRKDLLVKILPVIPTRFRPSFVYSNEWYFPKIHWAYRSFISKNDRISDVRLNGYDYEILNDIKALKRYIQSFYEICENIIDIEETTRKFVESKGIIEKK